MTKLKEKLKLRGFVVLFSLVVVLVFSGCTQSSGGGSGSGGDIGSSFNGGSEALTYEFVQGAPPEKIYDGGTRPFNIRVRITNNGEFDIPEGSGYVVLSGVNPPDFNLNDDTLSKPIPPINGYKLRGESVIKGREQVVTFPDLKYIPSHVAPISHKVFVNFCYPYRTTSIISVCLSGDPLSNIEEGTKVCDVENSNLDYANSGSPISIENPVQYASGQNTIDIKFNIVHNPKTDKGSLVFERGSFDKFCEVGGKNPGSYETLDKRDKIIYTVESGVPGLICGDGGSNQGSTYLIENRAEVFCTQNVESQKDHIRPFRVTLEYDYFEKDSVDLLISPSGREAVAPS